MALEDRSHTCLGQEQTERRWESCSCRDLVGYGVGVERRRGQGSCLAYHLQLIRHVWVSVVRWLSRRTAPPRSLASGAQIPNTKRINAPVLGERRSGTARRPRSTSGLARRHVRDPRLRAYLTCAPGQSAMRCDCAATAMRRVVLEACLRLAKPSEKTFPQNACSAIVVAPLARASAANIEGLSRFGSHFPGC